MSFNPERAGGVCYHDNLKLRALRSCQAKSQARVLLCILSRVGKLIHTVKLCYRLLSVSNKASTIRKFSGQAQWTLDFDLSVENEVTVTHTKREYFHQIWRPFRTCFSKSTFTITTRERLKVTAKLNCFLPRDAMRKRNLCCRPVSVRLSVRHVRVLYPDG